MSGRTLLLPLLSCSLLAAPSWAQPQITTQASAASSFALEVGETRLIRLSEKVVRISVADPQVADVRVVTPLQIIVTAKAVGYTHLVLWGENDKPLVLAVSVRRNLSELRTQIQDLFPKESIKITSAGDLVVLSGQASDLRVPARLAEIAKLHSKRIANLVEVKGEQQVQLEVRFAEVSRSGLRRMGFGFLWRDSLRGTEYIGNLASPGARASSSSSLGGGAGNLAPPVPLPTVGDSFSMIFSTGLSQFPFSAVLSVLSQQGLSKTLAEPVLVALSGQEAQFHAGGEVPILISQQFGAVNVQFKKFGVQLKFVPTVLGEKTISMKVRAEVSEPDTTIGVALGGYQIPGFKTRSSETTIRLKDGQSFAIAGMLSDQIRSVVKKVPLLGEIPILGSLFRSTQFQRDETELLVVVKSHLVRPVQLKDQLPMPGEEGIFDYDDFQLFMLGRIEGKQEKRERSKETREEPGGPAGPVGFLRD